MCVGVRNGAEWAGSSKRRYARLWLSVVDMLEGNTKAMQWMPAHTSAASIGCVSCSDGCIVDEVRWSSNQIVDILAKEAAEQNRVPARFGNELLKCEARLKELLIYLGRLTNEANGHETADGVIRDSDPLAPKFRPKRKGRAKCGKTRGGTPGRSDRAVASSRGRGGLSSQIWQMPSPKPCGVRKSHPNAQTQKKRVLASSKLRDTESEYLFAEWWRERREQVLRPPSSGRQSACERIAALKVRILTKNNTRSSSD